MFLCATTSRLLVRFVSTRGGGGGDKRSSGGGVIRAAVPSSRLVPSFVSTGGGDPRDSRSSGIQTASSRRMPNGVKKENLPQKTCVVCNRPFTWRKKWERCWDEVTTCSKSCNAKRKKNNQREREKGEEGTRGSVEEDENEEEKNNSSKGNKRCDKCGESRSMLVRCQIDESKAWKMICVKGCWKSVSGGVTDGTPEFPHYKYGGVWKNRRKVSMDGDEKRIRKKEETPQETPLAI